MDPKQVTYPLLSLHLSHRTKQLTDYISHTLNLESHLPNSTKKYSVLLIRLGEDDLARSTYLQSRAEYVRRKIRAMQHPGAYGTNEVDGFVEAVAWLIVRVIKNSWAVYSETFSETKIASIFFEWVKEQAEGTCSAYIDLTATGFSEVFRRQLYGYPHDSQLYKSSKTGVMGVWSELKGLGLDITFLLDALIEQHSTEEKAVSSEIGSSEAVRNLELQSM
jgi:exocyst complex component 8